MLTNIVVPLDGSKFSWSAARHAIQMAHLYNSTVHGMSITDVKIIEGRLLDGLNVDSVHIHGISITDVKIIEGQLLDGLNVDSATAQNFYQDEGRLLLEQLEKDCNSTGVAFQQSLTTGMVPSSICRAASQVRAELIIMGKKGINAQWSGPLLGTTAESVVRQAKRPVLLAQEVYSPIETVYIAYDGGFVSIRALRFAAELCARCQWQMKVISINRSKERRDKLLNEAVEMVKLHGLKITTIGKSGDVMKQILDITSEEPNALIILGAYSSRLRGLILGNVPERIMRRAPQPVLIYRPLTS